MRKTSVIGVQRDGARSHGEDDMTNRMGKARARICHFCKRRRARAREEPGIGYWVADDGPATHSRWWFGPS